MDARTIWGIVDSFLLTHEVEPGTEDYYRRTVSVLCAWHGRDVLADEFTPELCNHFLVAKQRAGKSSYYRRSLRSGLRALLNEAGQDGKLRSVKLEQLNHSTWGPEEVAKLCAVAPSRYWKTLIPAAYYTGLSGCDLEEIEYAEIRADGVIARARRKTGKLAVVKIPAWLVEEIGSGAGKVWQRSCSREWFRKQFKRIVKAAGLRGSFKKLRASSGTEVERLYPGRGHLHLANTRAVFERHYLPAAWRIDPLEPPPLPHTG